MTGVVTVMIIPLAAVAFNLIITVLGALKTPAPRPKFFAEVRGAVVRASQYGAVIGMLFIAGHYDASLHGWAVGAAWVIGLAELAAGLTGAGLPPGVTPPKS